MLCTQLVAPSPSCVLHYNGSLSCIHRNTQNSRRTQLHCGTSQNKGRVFCSEQKNKLWEGGQNGSGRSSAHTFGFRSMFWGDRFTPQFSFQEQQRHTAPFLQCSPSKNLEDGTEKGILRQAQKLLVRTVPKQKPASEQAHIQVSLQHSNRNTKNTYFLKYEPFLPLLAIYG